MVYGTKAGLSPAFVLHGGVVGVWPRRCGRAIASPIARRMSSPPAKTASPVLASGFGALDRSEGRSLGHVRTAKRPLRAALRGGLGGGGTQDVSTVRAGGRSPQRGN